MAEFGPRRNGTYTAMPRALECIHCGLPDSVHHRLWVCGHEAAVAARKRRATDDVIRRAVVAGDRDPVFNRRWVVFNSAELESPARHGGVVLKVDTAEYHHTGGDPWEYAERAGLFQGIACADGSCAPHLVPELSRAAWAAVAMRGAGPVAVVSGPVLSPIAQTSQAAEWCALAAAAEVTGGPTVVHSDSQGVVGACEGSGRGPVPWGYWKKRHGAIARQA